MSLEPLFGLLVVIFVSHLFFSRGTMFRLPSVITYLVVGMLLRSSGLALFVEPSSAWVIGIGHFGLCYLLFLSGLEVDVGMLFQKGNQKPLKIGSLMFLTTVVLAYLCSWGMHHIDPSITPWMMTLVLSTTSLGIVLPALKERGVVSTEYGQTLLASAVLADLVTTLAVSVVADVYHHGLSVHQAGVVLLFVGVFLFYFLIRRVFQSRLWTVLFQNSQVIKLQGVLAVVGLFSLVASWIGLEPIFGSFLAGLMLAAFRLRETNRLRQLLEGGGYGIFVPLFFILAGMQFHWQEVLVSTTIRTWLPLLLLVALGVKVLPMLWYGRPFGEKPSWAGGMLLSARLTLVLVASSIGVRLGLIPHAINEALMIVTVVTSILAPLLFDRLLPKRL
ncbi:MAG TPA: cation:proton antiporter [Bacilli bacterium]|nr:cation:proton antiporter [Bacilli bacterium]